MLWFLEVTGIGFIFSTRQMHRRGPALMSRMETGSVGWMGTCCFQIFPQFCFYFCFPGSAFFIAMIR